MLAGNRSNNVSPLPVQIRAGASQNRNKQDLDSKGGRELALRFEGNTSSGEAVLKDGTVLRDDWNSVCLPRRSGFRLSLQMLLTILNT